MLIGKISTNLGIKMIRIIYASAFWRRLNFVISRDFTILRGLTISIDLITIDLVDF